MQIDWQTTLHRHKDSLTACLDNGPGSEPSTWEGGQTQQPCMTKKSGLKRTSLIVPKLLHATHNDVARVRRCPTKMLLRIMLLTFTHTHMDINSLSRVALGRPFPSHWGDHFRLLSEGLLQPGPHVGIDDEPLLTHLLPDL